MKPHPVILALALLGALGGTADAQGRGKEKSAGRGSQVAVTHRPGTDAEIRIIRDFYSEPSRKPKALPPGIAKNLARGKPLPPGIARTRVPDQLLVRLPTRTGTRWLVVGDRVLLVDASDIVVDLIRLTF
jgi:hypothetical protein